jgi:predicted permease
MLADLRQSVRRLARAPGFTATAALTLALGIGANATIFSLVNAVFLRPLPVQEPQRLVRVFTTWRGDGHTINAGALGLPDVQALDAERSVFAGVAALGRARVALGEGEAARTVQTALVTANYFGVLGVRPALGRALTPDDTRAEGASAVAVLSHQLWRERFGADSALLGRAIALNGRSYTVVGVAPRTFRGTDVEGAPELWVPVTQARALGVAGPTAFTGARWLHGMARLREGVDRARAGDAVARIARGWTADAPATHTGWGLRLVTGATLLAFDPSENAQVAIVFGAVSALALLVLAVTAANVANLQLARAATRRREVAMRVALGASRGRLVRELLAESVVLATIAGTISVAFGSAGAALLPRLGLPPMIDLAPDWRLLVYTLALSLGTGVLFGLAPALWSARGALVAGMKDGTAGSGRARSRLRGALVVGQMAVSLVLLVAAGLLLRTVDALRSADAGFDGTGVLAVGLDVGTRGYDEARGVALYGALLERARALPGVESATLGSVLPLSGRGMSLSVRLPERPERPMRDPQIDVVGTDFFRTMRIPIADGRPLGPEDRAGAPRAVVVSEAFARDAWPGARAVGQRLRVEEPGAPELTVVGVARDARFQRLSGAPEPMLYLPLAQRWTPEMIVQLRATTGTPRALLGAVQRELRALDPDLPIDEVRTLDEVRTEAMFPARLMATMLAAFGALALGVACVGLAAVVAFAASQRTRELGVRMALGAAAGDVQRLIVADGLRLTAVGVGVGLLLAAGVARLLASQLYGVSAADPLTFVLVPALLGGVALLAAWVPARRASRADPLVALRAE